MATLMDRSLKAALFLAFVLCFFRVAYHAAQAIHQFPMSASDLTSSHIDDAGGYGILALIFCYVIYRIRPKK
jgi:hypothetical protein